MAFTGVGAAGVGALGDIASGAISSAFQAAAATKAFHRQKMVMKNQIQWRYKDLEQAGINPMLAAGWQGSTANVAMPTMPRFGPLGTAAVSTALNARKNAAELKAIKASTQLTNQSTHTAAQLEMKHQADAAMTRTENEMLSTGLSAAHSMEAMDKTKTGGVLRQIKRVMEAISPFKGATGIGRRPGGN